MDSLKDKVEQIIPKLICPICKTRLFQVNYIGEKESHSAWFCQCKNFPGAMTVYGEVK